MKFTNIFIIFLAITLLCCVMAYKDFSDDELKMDDSTELYRQYLLEHPHKKYNHLSTEGKKRIHHFKKNVERIKKQRLELKNKKNNWKAGLNSLSDMSDEEFKGLHGHRKSSKKGRKHGHKKSSAHKKGKVSAASFLQRTDKRIKVQSKDPFPTLYDWSNLFLAARNQGTCGSCWAFAAATVMEGFYNKQNPTAMIYLSAQQITTCATASPNNGCMGGNPMEALTTLTINGLVPESTLPYTASDYGMNEGPACTFSGDLTGAFANKAVNGCEYDSTNSLTDTMVNSVWSTSSDPNCSDSGLYALLANGPVAVTIDGTVLQHYTGGIFDSPCSTLNHGVAAVGYGVDSATGLDYWIIRNSWAATWGENGYMRLQRDFNNQNSCFVGGNYFQPTF